MSEHVDLTPTCVLIDILYEELGVDRWSKPRALRLCAKLNETEAELAKRLRISRSTLRRRYTDGFTGTEGVLLSHIERGVDVIRTRPAPATEP